MFECAGGVEVKGKFCPDCGASERDPCGRIEGTTYPGGIDAAKMKAVIDFIDSWISNPVSSYSVAALEGLFAISRDKINSLHL